MTADDGKLKDRIALVTGAASGIGEATARLFAVEGATVIVSDVRFDAAQAILDTGGTAEAVALDVTDEAAWQSATASIAERKI